MRKLSLTLMLVAISFAVGCDGMSLNLNLGSNRIQGSGVLLKEARDVPAFTEIDLSGGYEVVVTCGEEHDVQISGDDNIVPLVKTKVVDGVLHVSMKESVKTKEALKLVISAEKINSMSVSGAVDAHITGVDNDEFAVSVSGAADLTMEGATSELKLDLSGAGSIEAEDLQAKTAAIDVSGAGSVVLTVDDELSASISGAGSIEYCGDPEVVNKSVSGLGSIRKK